MQFWEFFKKVFADFPEKMKKNFASKKIGKFYILNVLAFKFSTF